MPLVDIPSTTTLEGFSPVLKVRQRVDSRALPNLLAFAAAFHRKFGRPLIVTEAARTRPRQLWLWENRVALGIAVAPPYTSRHDEINHGTAVDLGSGIATLGTPAADWAHANGTRYGVHWTGQGFNESWHFEIQPGTETVAINRTEIRGLLMALTDTEQTELLQKVRELHRIELVAGQGYSYANAANNAATAALNALVVPTEETKPYKPIDVLVSHVKAILTAVKEPGDTATPPATVADIDYDRIATLVADKLASSFAAVNANIDDQPTEFRIVPTS